MKKIFDTHGADSELNCRSGQTVEVIRPLTEKEADLCETGPMYHIRFPDGFETDAFADELSDIPGSEPKEHLFRALIEPDVTAASGSNALDLTVTVDYICTLAYSKYQLDWMARHHYSLEDLMQGLTDYQYRDPEDSDAISEPIRNIFDQWESDPKDGDCFDGERWKSLEEFLRTDYLDPAYMISLLDQAEWRLYQRERRVHNSEMSANN